MPIAPPNPHIKRTLARKIFDGGVSGIPAVGGVFAGIYSMTHPAKSELELIKWRNDMCAAFNSLEKQLEYFVGEIPLTDDAAEIGFYLAKNAQTGRSDRFTYQEIETAFPSANKLELSEALGSLENAGLVVLTAVIGAAIHTIRLKHQLHEIFDPLVYEGVNPREDAVIIAEEVLATERMISSEELMNREDWSVRRMNPALLIVGEMIGDGRKSTPMGTALAIRAIGASPSERATLRAFIDATRATS